MGVIVHRKGGSLFGPLMPLNWGKLRPEARWAAGGGLCECVRVWNGKKVLGTGDAPGKAAHLPDTVLGRAEHGGQGLGEALCCCISYIVSCR